MSQLNSKNFYEVLGVDKTADERAIKKAYFGLVRKYPPETHAEEFKKIREAYEVLSDANSRREYDSVGEVDQHGEEVSAKMREAMTAMDEERYLDAQSVLTELLEARPDLHFARDLLGVAYLRNKQPQEALDIFVALVESNPENAAYHLHQAYAHHALKQYPQAEAAYGEARAHDPDDVRPLVALADCFMDQRRWDDAVKTLDEAIHQDGSVDFRDFALFLRKLEIEIERKQPKAMAAVLAELMQIIPEDPAARKMVANRLASFAAPLFAQKRVDEANLLMRECAKLDPNRSSGRMPTSFSVDIERLPEASKQWLVQQNKTKSFGKVNGSPYALAIFLLLLGLGTMFFPFVIMFTEEQAMPIASILTLGLFFAGAAWLTAYSFLRIVAAAKSPYGAYTMVHPLYLLNVKVDELIAWPLANLHDVRVTHRHTNGIYNGSGIDLVFAKRTFTTTIYGKDQSVQWANHVLGLRRRMLELMYSGLLEDTTAENNLIPAGLIPEEGKPPVPTENQLKLKKRNRTIYLSVGGVCLLMSLIAIPVNARNVERHDFDRAHQADQVESYQRYLALHPKGRHAGDAIVAIEAIYDRALERAKKNRDAELHDALIDIITTLKDKKATHVRVNYESKTLFQKLDMDKLPPALAKNIVNPIGAFTDSANKARERQITASLERAFGEAVGPGLVSFVEVGSAPVTMDVKYEVALTGSVYSSVKPANGPKTAADDERFFGIGFFWNFEVTFTGDDEPRYSFEVASEPAKDIHWTSYDNGYGRAARSPTLPYDKMAESAFDDFKEGLAKRFGVASAKPRERANEARDPGDDEGDDDEDADLAPPTHPPQPPPARKPPAPLPKRPLPKK